MQFVGSRYVWGAAGPTQFDCSGFTQYVYGRFGVSLPHYDVTQAGFGTGVSYASAQPGDLLRWSGHVAIYIGGGQVINALNPAKGVTVNPVSWLGAPLAVRRLV